MEKIKKQLVHNLP